MSRPVLAVIILVLAVVGYFGYRFMAVQKLAQQYTGSKEISSASLRKEGSVWTIRMEAVIQDPVDPVWKAMREPQRASELVPAAFQRSAVLEENEKHKKLDLQVTLLSLPAQTMVADLDFDDAAKTVTITTSKGLQDIHGTYVLTSQSPQATVLTFSGTATEKVALPVPQSVTEGALRELFIVQVRQIRAALHGKDQPAPTTQQAAAPAAAAEAFCSGPPHPGARKLVVVAVAPAGAAASAPAADFRNDTAKGYERGYTIDGIPIREEYDVETTCTKATATAGKLTVQVESTILRPENLEAWVRDVKLKALAEMQVEPGKQADPEMIAGFLPPAQAGWEVVPPEIKPTLESPITFRMYEQSLF